MPMISLDSERRLFADDFIRNFEANDVEDTLKFQNNIDRLGWEGQEVGYEVPTSQMQ